MSGTRRMWSRRLLRAGWLVAPVFAFPGAVFRWVRSCFRAVFYDHRGNFETGLAIFMAIVVLIVYGFATALMAMEDHVSKPADPEEIKAAMVDPCAKGQLLARLQTGMIRGVDISQAEKACEQKREQLEQLRMLEEQRATLGVK